MFFCRFHVHVLPQGLSAALSDINLKTDPFVILLDALFDNEPSIPLSFHEPGGRITRKNQMKTGLALIFLICVVSGLGCPGDSSSRSAPEAVYSVNVFESPSTYAAFCESPRSGTDPST